MLLRREHGSERAEKPPRHFSGGGSGKIGVKADEDENHPRWEPQGKTKV
jgi:hypothetical protein